ncbi:MAG: NADP-dependent malic enzyme [bacterium]
MLLRSLIGEKTTENFELPAETEKLSLEEKSVELHKRAKGVIKIENNFNNENISDETKRISEEISKNPDAAYQLTPKGNLVAVISDGSAVLGLGNIGAEAALPVMEGKSVLFKTLGDVDAMPICLKTQNTDELIKIISKLSPILGGINLEDISAPRCFEIENALIEKLNIPVFHDDQHGTAVVVLAGFINSLKLVGKKAEEIKVVVNGAGAGATAVAKLLLNYGVKNLILCDRTGAIYNGRTEGMNFFKQEMAEITNPCKEKGLFKDVIKNADFFIGLSSGNIVNQEMIKSMAKKAVVFALANPIPEIMPEEALKAGAFIVATGRSDYKNQVNNSLAFPGIFRGVLDVRAEKITDEMKISAAHAIANLIQEHELNSEYIIPHALDLKVPPAVAKAVAETAIKANIAGIKI